MKSSKTKVHSTKSKEDPKRLAYDLLDEPVANPRYGGMTMREAVLLLKREKPKPKNSDD